MKIRTFVYFVRSAVSSLRHNGLMSIASVSTVSLSLLILGLFLIMVLNLNHMASALESQVQVSIFLQDDLTEDQTKNIGNQIRSLPGVLEASYVNKDEALARFSERLGEQKSLLTALGNTNPLPNAFEVKVDVPDRVQAVARAAGEIEGVETAKYNQEFVEQLFGLTHMLRLSGIILILFLALAAMFIISNTIRITVFARRREINIMRYVGATDSFIRWPFVIEGVILGFFGALLSVFLLNQAYQAFADKIYETVAFLPIIPKYPFLHILTSVLLLVGALIGAAGSTISLKRFLRAEK
ncbi:permease-like cell division protein FtsX [Acetonema longum]|uniref:Cell division protein FtsX n=1 Tax=Acetonema longum DSM 6540 TaxID=1009370 RepID=F7NNY3_9FIRM|nr:permease-like cell division protein FtsX [Acetonema longum]EGO62317.1 hypothetical protein ALO_19122 [Acetonema longum DSM 6540]